MTVRVVLVRPWVDGRGGGGCCGGEVRDGVAPAPLERGRRLDVEARPHDHADATTRVYRRLRQDHPDADTQVTPANNVWLLGWAFGRVRADHGALRAASAAAVAMRPGAVLVDGLSVAQIDDGPDTVSRAVGHALTRREVARG